MKPPSGQKTHAASRVYYFRNSPRRSCRAFVPWNLLILDAQIETDLALGEAVDQQPDDREHRQGHNPFGLLPPTRAIAAGFLIQRKPGSTMAYCS